MTFTSDSQAQNQHRKFVCHFVRVGNLMLFLLVVVAVVLFEADDNNNIIIYNTNIYIYACCLQEKNDSKLHRLA